METRKRGDKIRYRESVYIEGKKIHGPFFNRKSDAKKWKSDQLLKKEKVKLQGKLSIVEFNKEVTLSEFASEWIDNRVAVKNTKGTLRVYKSTLRYHLLPSLGDKKLIEISTFDLEEFRSNLKAKGINNNKGVNIIMSVLKSLMNDAVFEKVIPSSPFTGLKNLSEGASQYRFFSKKDMINFLKYSKKTSNYELYLTALFTGMRKGELAGLCWDAIDFDSNVIIVKRSRNRYELSDNTKSGKVRYIPMHPVLRRMFRRLMRELRHGKYVFADKSGRELRVHHLYRIFRKDQIEAGIDDPIRFHDLRHTFASHFMMNNGNIYDLQKILGHSDLSMTQKYAHHSPGHLQGSIKHFALGDDERMENLLGTFR